MNSRTLLNLALVLFLAALAFVITLEPGIEPEPEVVRLSSLNAVDINHIRIEQETGEPLEFSKVDGSWLIARDTPVEASEFKVHSLLGILEARAVRSYASNTVDLEKLSLQPIETSVTFNGQTRFVFGATESLERLRYVQSGNTVHLIEDRYQHLIETEFTSYISHGLLPGDASIVSLQLPDFSLRRDDTVGWKLSPEDTTVSADAIQILIDSWQRASALWVRPFESQATDKTIEIKLASKDQPLVFTIVSMEPEVVLARPDFGIQYHLPADVAKTLLAFAQETEQQEQSGIPQSQHISP